MVASTGFMAQFKKSEANCNRSILKSSSFIQHFHPQLALQIYNKMFAFELHGAGRQHAGTIHARKAIASQGGEADAAAGVHAAMAARGDPTGAHVGENELMSSGYFPVEGAYSSCSSGNLLIK
jgi:hypothetical protein